MGGSMTARMRDVAQRAGVSVKTVSNVLNHYPHVTPETRARVDAAIAELDYRPNLGARSLRKGRCGVIALVIPDLAVQYFAGLAGAVGRAAKKRGVAVLIEQTDGHGAAEDLALDGLRDRLVDGVLLWPTAPTGTAADPSRPVVLLGEGRADLACDRVSIGRELSLMPDPSEHEAFADEAVGLLLDRVAGVGPPEQRHVVIQAIRAREANGGRARWRGSPSDHRDYVGSPWGGPPVGDSLC
ncbi:LacI family DNA-binding transcriptional regulator [Kribbella sp. NPDC023972]|uniref:LacI family DNA-binding transcriptional regulator n=1 Tax=Kribbella sp. NPDC023972 TaxID=3154795 RepID=UPI0033E3BD3D